MSAFASNRSPGAVAALFTVWIALATAGPAFAQGHGGGGGGGGGHFGGGGGGHIGGGGAHVGGFGGGGAHMGGAPHIGGFGGPGAHMGGLRGGTPHFSGTSHYTAGSRGIGAPNFAGGTVHFVSPPRAGGAVAHYAARPGAAGAHVGYAPRPGISSGHYVAGTHGYVPGTSGAWHGRPGFVGRPGRPGWHGGYGRYWGGGYWGGTFWPRVNYWWGFPLFLPVLPAVYATYYWGGIPYYYANDVYYTWNPGQNGYVVTDPPPVEGTAEGGSAENQSADAQPASDGDIYAYPENGQTEEQQSNDRYECHTWAKSQTGFDPTVSDSSGNPDDYRRATVACLDARGYSAK